MSLCRLVIGVVNLSDTVCIKRSVTGSHGFSRILKTHASLPFAAFHFLGYGNSDLKITVRILRPFAGLLFHTQHPSEGVDHGCVRLRKNSTAPILDALYKKGIDHPSLSAAVLFDLRAIFAQQNADCGDALAFGYAITYRVC